MPAKETFTHIKHFGAELKQFFGGMGAIKDAIPKNFGETNVEKVGRMLKKIPPPSHWKPE